MSQNTPRLHLFYFLLFTIFLIFNPSNSYSDVLGVIQLMDSGYTKGVYSYHSGENVYIQVADPDVNSASDSVETLLISVTSDTEGNGNYELVTLTETGINTGIFQGFIALDDSGSTVAVDDNLDVVLGDTIITIYNDFSDNSGGPTEVRDKASFGSILHVGMESSGYTYTSVQTAIDKASTGDEIIVHNGTYVENINFNGKAVTVRSENGVAYTTIDGNFNNSVVSFESGEKELSVIDGFTIQNGNGKYGGGIFLSNSTPTITNCTITNNTATRKGGGAYCGSPTSPPTPITITNCSITNNTAAEDGGGIYSSDVRIANCSITNNVAGKNGGGISSSSSLVSITKCTITDNVAGKNGGGVYFSGSANSPTITNCTITNNIASGDGGGISSKRSSPIITNCTITDNTAAEGGGGVSYFPSDTFYIQYNEITNCIIANNTAKGGGGVLCGSSSISIWITNCTITNNSANGGDGGGIYSFLNTFGLPMI